MSLLLYALSAICSTAICFLCYANLFDLFYIVQRREACDESTIICIVNYKLGNKYSTDGITNTTFWGRVKK